MPTSRKPEVIEGIIELTERNGFAPTTRELADHLGMWHSSVHRVLLRLREDGEVSWENGRARTLVVNHVVEPSISPITLDPSA